MSKTIYKPNKQISFKIPMQVYSIIKEVYTVTERMCRNIDFVMKRECIICSYQFCNIGDIVNLMITDRGNLFVCVDCFDEQLKEHCNETST